MSEATKLSMVKEYWKHADAGLADEFARMNAGFRFYTGDQWSPGDLAIPLEHSYPIRLSRKLMLLWTLRFYLF